MECLDDDLGGVLSHALSSSFDCPVSASSGARSIHISVEGMVDVRVRF